MTKPYNQATEDARYALCKFACAMHMMAVSEEPLRLRVEEAYGEFHPALLGMDKFPEYQATALRHLHTGLTEKGGITKTLAGKTPAEIRRLANEIADVFTVLGSYVEQLETG